MLSVTQQVRRRLVQSQTRIVKDNFLEGKKMTIRKYILPLGLALLSPISSHHSFAEAPTNINVKTSKAKGLCVITLPGGNAPETDKSMSLEFTYRPSDGIFRVSVLVNGWPRAQEEDPNKDFPLTLTFDTEQTTASGSGGYSSGFNDKLWGIWPAGDSANEAVSMLIDAKSVHLKADGMDLGKFDLQVKGMVYNWINNCAIEKRENDK
ncbi:MAG: hypothetical protein K9G26_04680 [Emcibacter sp.]|nr:hypothetical protein [Emcibacter sp.]